MMENIFNGIVGPIKPGCCRLSYNGQIAIRVSDGTYKTYNMKTGALTNCSKFVFDVADDLFMVVPTRKLRKGDIVLFGGKPKCIIDVGDKKVTAVNYEDSTVQTILPERHVFLGRQFYGKIVSLMGNGFGAGKGGFFKNILKFKMMSTMMGGGSTKDGVGGMFGGNALPMMMLMSNGSMDGMFGDMFDDSSDEDGEGGDVFGMFGDDSEDEADEEAAPKKAPKAKKAAKRK